LFYSLRKESSAPFAHEVDLWLQPLLPFYALIVAVLMVSRIPYPHIVNQLFRGQRSFGHVVGLVFAIAAVMLIPGYSVPILCCNFVIAPPIRHAIQVIRERKASRESWF
jgi:phosphatidylserine synthase